MLNNKFKYWEGQILCIRLNQRTGYCKHESVPLCHDLLRLSLCSIDLLISPFSLCKVRGGQRRYLWGFLFFWFFLFCFWVRVRVRARPGRKPRVLVKITDSTNALILWIIIQTSGQHFSTNLCKTLPTLLQLRTFTSLFTSPSLPSLHSLLFTPTSTFTRPVTGH